MAINTGPSETDYAWAAGFLDGEGHFDAFIRETKPGHTIRGIRLTAPQCHPEVLERLQSTLGGTIRKRKPPKNPNHSQRWDWKLSGYERVNAAYLNMKPYLGSVKRAQAEAAIELWVADSPNRKVYNRKAQV